MTKVRMKIFTTDSAAYEYDSYFDWLCHLVEIPSVRPYFRLAMTLHGMAFKPEKQIETDENRAQDGLRLRVEFMEKYGVHGSSKNRGPCSMLEFLIALARRMSFVMCEDEADTDSKTSYYFWKLIENLRLLKLDDERFLQLNGDFFVAEAVDRVLHRTYDSTGEGGLFPLKNDHGDQRCDEIWYQMQFWLGENMGI